MNVTRHVIVDLLPAYAAAETHADSAKLVEHWLQSDATLRRELDALRGVDTALEVRDRAPAADGELLALRRTRVALKLRSTLLGLAIFLSLLPFSVRGGEDGLQWLVLGNPALAIVVAALAVASWLGWFLFAARLRVRSGV